MQSHKITPTLSAQVRFYWFHFWLLLPLHYMKQWNMKNKRKKNNINTHANEIYLFVLRHHSWTFRDNFCHAASQIQIELKTHSHNWQVSTWTGEDVRNASTRQFVATSISSFLRDNPSNWCPMTLNINKIIDLAERTDGQFIVEQKTDAA